MLTMMVTQITVPVDWRENGVVEANVFGYDALLHSIDGDGCYLPPVSIKDSANAASKIMKCGTKIIAVALDDDDSEGTCYEQLKDIYPATVACSDLKRLTGQLLEIVSKQLV